MEAIKATSDTSLASLSRMLSVFHPSDSTSGLARIGALVDELRPAGLPVELTMTEVTLPDEADALAYRVVQESLTNVLQHAGLTTANVQVLPAGGDMLVQAGDRGRCTADDTETPGRGLAGLRRRVEAVGGRFSAGSRTGGRFQVTARLPRGAVHRFGWFWPTTTWSGWACGCSSSVRKT